MVEPYDFKSLRLVFKLLCIGGMSLSVALLNPSWAQEPPAGEITGESTGQCETPNVVILLDRSGSMLDDDKWGQAQEAIERGVVPFLERLRFGLVTFPWEDGCDVSEGSYRVPIGEATAENLGQVFVDATPVDTALTPLAEAINRGKAVLDDLNDSNRRGVLVLLTDGVETCADADAPLTAAQAAADEGYLIYTIGFGSLVSRRTLRSMAEIGGTERERSAEDLEELAQVLTEIIEGVTQEQCDLLDNDCDGVVDEDVEATPCEGQCGVGERRCVEGQLSECIPNNRPTESCDGMDNDCDGYIDENRTFTCDLPDGSLGHLNCEELMMSVPSLDDCLPLPDPNNPGGSGDPNDPNNPGGSGDPNDPNNPGGSGDPNDPNNPGGSGDPNDPNNPGGSGDPNDPNQPGPTAIPEGCDGVDNDGDGLIDEGSNQECQVDCHRGRRMCVEGDLIGCTAPPAQDERCNGYDDDCDGLIDEMNPCPGAERCGDEGICHPPCEPDGSCGEGFVCGADGYCDSAPCDPGCDAGYLCVAGRCVYPCSVNTDCPSGTRCERRRCVAGDGGGTSQPPSSGPTGGTGAPPPPAEAGYAAPTAGTGYVPTPTTPGDAGAVNTTEGGSCEQGPGQSVTWLLLLSLLGVMRLVTRRAQA